MSNVTPRNALLLAGLLLVSGWASISPTLASHEAGDGITSARGTVHFARPDQQFYADGAQVFGHGAGAMIILRDRDLADPTFTVNVRSLSDTAGENIVLRRVTLPDGRSEYHGFVGVETTLIPNNGNVFVRHNDRFTVVYFDADRTGTGLPGVSSHNLTWIQTWTGRLGLDKQDYFGIGEVAEIEVVDPDIAANSPGFCVRVWSDSDPIGFNMTLWRKVRDGTYRGNLGFTFGASTTGWPGVPTSDPCWGSVVLLPPPPPALPRLRVRDGDRIYVNYTLLGFDERGRLEDAKVSAIWQTAHNGRVQFTTSDFRRVLSENPNTPTPTETVYGTDRGNNINAASAWIRVEDRDLRGAGTIRINVRSQDPINPIGNAEGTDPTGVVLTLHETTDPRNPYVPTNAASPQMRSREYGEGSGEFIGYLSFHTDPSITDDRFKRGCVRESGPAGDCRLRVREGAHVIARYDDKVNVTGDFQTVESRVTWRQSMTGILQFKAGVDSLHRFPQDPAHYTTDAVDEVHYNATWVPNTSPFSCLPVGGGANQACHWDRGYVELRDTDLRGLGMTNVTVHSAGDENPQRRRDPLGIQLLLIEAADGFGNPTGVFRGSFGFNATHSSDGQATPYSAVDQLIWAWGCDDLVVEYFDERTEQGRTQWVTDVYRDVVTIKTAAWAPKCGNQNQQNESLRGRLVTENLGIYDSAVSGSNSLTDLYGYREYWVILVDNEQNRSNATREITNRTLIVASDNYTAQSGWPGTRATVNLGVEQLNVTMIETATPGVFAGRFQLVPPGMQDADGPNLPVNDGDRVCAYWSYTNQTGRMIRLLMSNEDRFTLDPAEKCSTWHRTYNPKIEFRSGPHQGASMNNRIGVGPEAAVFYNGTGHAWTWNEATETLSSNKAWVYVRDLDTMTETKTMREYADDTTITITSESHLQGIAVTLREVYGFQNFSETPYTYQGRCAASFGGGGTCLVPALPGLQRRYDSLQDDRGLLGVFNVTTQLKLTSTGAFDRDWYDQRDLLYVRDGDTITATYRDARNLTGQTQTYTAFVDWQQRHTAVLDIEHDTYRNHDSPTNPLNRVIVTLRDKDLDTTVAQQVVTVRATNERTRASVPVTLEETGPSTGVFRGEFCFVRLPAPPAQCATSSDASDISLPVADEDRVIVNYTDRHDANGIRRELSDSARWYDTTAARMWLDAKDYSTFGARARVTIEDFDLDTTQGPDTVHVWVRSETDGAGELIPLTETGGRTRIFTGTFEFQETYAPNDGRVHVADGDRVTVYFFDRKLNNDFPSTSPKTQTAIWNAEPNMPPVLSLNSLPRFDTNLSIVPIHFGEVIAFYPQAADEDGKVMGFDIDFGDGSPRVVTTEGRAPSGQPLLKSYAFEPFFEGFSEAQASSTVPFVDFKVRFSAWDDDGAREDMFLTVRAFRPDRDPPGGITDALVIANQTTSDSIVLEFTAPQNNDNREDDVAAAKYVVRYRTDEVNPATEEGWPAATNATDIVYMLPSGAEGKANPGQKQRIVVRDLQSNTRYNFAVRAEDDDPARNLLARRVPNQPSVEIKATDVDTVHAVGYAQDLTTVEDRHGKGVGDFDGAGPVTTRAGGCDVPAGNLNVRSTSHTAGVETNDTTVDLVWGTATSTCSVSYRVVRNTQAAAPTITPTSGTQSNTNTTTVTITASGTHYIHVAACNSLACGTVSTIGPLRITVPSNGGGQTPTITNDDLLATNEELQGGVRVTRTGTTNTITWDLPSDPPAPIEGVQIWAGPQFALLVDLPKTDAAFIAREYEHEDAPDDATYVVTAYLGNTPALGKAGGLDPGALNGIYEFDQLAANAAAPRGEPLPPGGTDSSDGLLSKWWFWVLVGLGVLLLVGLIVGLVVRGRGGAGDEEEGMGWAGAEEGAPADEPWPEPPAADEGGTAVEEPSYEVETPVEAGPPVPAAPAAPAKPEPVEDKLTHHLTCPACGAGFTARGEKPMVTECPSCGVKGVLR